MIPFAVALLSLVLGAVGFAQGMNPDSVVSLEVPPHIEIPRGGEASLAITVYIEPGWHINAAGVNQEPLIPTTLTFEVPEHITVGEPGFPEPAREELPWTGRTLALYTDRIEVVVPLRASPDAPPGEGVLRGRLRYQACSGDVCLPPAEKLFTVGIRIVEPAGELPPPVSLGGERAAGGNPIAALIRERGLFLALLAVFLLGLGLNLTPCVYPMVPITVAYFGGIKGGTRRTLGMALSYLLGLAVVYSGLGVLAAATGRLFGEVLQRPWVWWLVAAVMVAMALSFFGLYHLRAPAFLTRRLPRGGRGGPVGALLMGALAGVVAAPCVGPATVALLSYVGITQDVGLGFALFFALALGLGSPYVILALFSQRLSRLPRTGAWTVWVERLLGFVLLGLALYFVAPFIPGRALPWAVAALAATGGIYLGLLQRSRGGPVLRAVRGAVGIAGIAVAILFLLPQGNGPAEASSSIAWEEYDPDALGGGKPVLLYFTAEWCVYCRKLEATTFSDGSFIAFLEGAGIRPIKVDLTVRTPLNEAIRRRYGVMGVPTLILLSPDGEELTRYAGYIEPDPLERRLKEALGPSGG
ncbi:cytochrome c biogenesis protein CcdA [Candidatus Bipolaricaulota sp. J31]